MQRSIQRLLFVPVVSFLAALAVVPRPSAAAVGTMQVRQAAHHERLPVYVADFISTAATGAAINDSGDVTGTSYRDPGCGPFCLPPLDTVIWRDGERIVLPAVPGLPGITVRS